MGSRKIYPHSGHKHRLQAHHQVVCCQSQRFVNVNWQNKSYSIRLRRCQRARSYLRPCSRCPLIPSGVLRHLSSTIRHQRHQTYHRNSPRQMWQNRGDHRRRNRGPNRIKLHPVASRPIRSPSTGNHHQSPRVEERSSMSRVSRISGERATNPRYLVILYRLQCPFRHRRHCWPPQSCQSNLLVLPNDYRRPISSLLNTTELTRRWIACISIRIPAILCAALLHQLDPQHPSHPRYLTRRIRSGMSGNPFLNLGNPLQ